MARKIARCDYALEAQPPHGFVMRYALAAALPEPLTGFLNGSFFLVTLRLLIDRRIAERVY